MLIMKSWHIKNSLQNASIKVKEHSVFKNNDILNKATIKTFKLT